MCPRYHGPHALIGISSRITRTRLPRRRRRTETTNAVKSTGVLTSKFPVVLGRDLQPASQRVWGKNGQMEMYLVCQGQVVGSLVGSQYFEVERPLEVTVYWAVIVEPHGTGVECGDRGRCGSSAGRDVELCARGDEKSRRAMEGINYVPGCYKGRA